MCPSEEHCDVLLVDDSEDAIALLAHELREAGLHVHAALSGEHALAHLNHHLPEAILLDVLMPGMNGFETCRRIRDLHKDLPVIFMTGLGETEHIVRGFEVGGNDYVTKPVSPPVVIARLQAHTRVARLSRATREAVNASDVAMLAVDQHGQLVWRNEATRALLEQVAPQIEATEGLSLHAALAPLRETALTEHHLDMGSVMLLAHRVTETGQAIAVYAIRRAESQSIGGWNPPKLTAREGEVLLWVAHGKTNRDIADILGMSPRTVAKHMEHIFEKLGVETRTAAAGAAQHFLKGRFRE